MFVCFGVYAQQNDSQKLQSETVSTDLEVLQLLETSIDLVKSDPGTSIKYARQTQRMAESITSDSLKAWVFMKLGPVYVAHRALEEAEQGYLLANQYYLKEPHKARQAAQVYYGIGRVYKLMGRYGDALISFEKGFSFAEEVGDTYMQAQLMRRTANISKKLGEMENALEFARSSVELSRKHGFNDVLAGAHTEAGFILIKLAQFPEAITEFKHSMSVSDSSDYESLADACDGIGSAYIEQGTLDSALFYYLNSMQFRSGLDDPESLHWNYINIGLVYQKMKEYPRAKDFIQRSLDYAREQQNEVMEGNSLLRLGRLEKDMGNNAVGLDHLMKAEALLNANGATSLELLSLKSIQRHFEDKGDYKNAMDYMHRHIKLERKIHSSESENRIEDMRVMYRTKMVEDELKFLEQENLIKDLEAEQLKRRMSITVMLIVFLLAIVCFFIFLWFQKSKANRIIRERNIRLDEMNVELQDLNKTKDRLFSIIGHDLKNPIHTIKGFMDLLKRREGKLTPETRIEYLGHISESIQNVSKLLENLLDWSRTQRKTISFKQQELDLNEIIRENIDLARATAEKKSIRLEAQTNEPVMVMADNNMINTLLRNLISNAVKFTGESGSVEIRTKAAATTVDVSVVDSGIGMSEEEIRNLFKVDMSVSRKGTSGESGTGLGLLICKEFVEKHNGAIHVTSEPGKGSTFSFDLPRVVS